ncbi:MAG: 16S rRNA (cytidine(1402)-2'-O)-methyltransferase [Desulfovermiculus sp.]|nr:16S rRNA (cytidine(1402)-2'-O)-methyltransferase [Desulfovermiculus sp.]
MPSPPPILWVVATPIGNLGDLSDRAKEVLSTVDVLLAEDTRKTGRFMQQMGLTGPRLFSLYEHNETSRIGQVLSLLAQGQDVALVSSAGTPLMSDPGYRLVQACWQAGFRVAPIPGPSAPVAALMASGLPPYPFVFLGFVPRKSGEKRRLFADFASTRATLVFFERLSRMANTLLAAYSVLGDRQVCLARELTKKHEEFIFLTLGSGQEDLSHLKGEVTVIVAPQDRETRITEEEEVVRIMESLCQPGDGAKVVVERTVPLIRGWGKKALYDLFLRQIQGQRNHSEES